MREGIVSQQAAAREARKHAGGMWLRVGQKRARNKEACGCGGVSAQGEVRMDAGGRRGGRAGVERRGHKAL